MTVQDNSDRVSGSISARVGFLEKGIEDLRSEIRASRAEFDRSLAASSTNLATQIDGLGRELRGRGVNWGWIISAVAMIVVLAGAILTPINGSLVDTKNALGKINDQLQGFYQRRDEAELTQKVLSHRLDNIDKAISENVTRVEHTEFSKRLDERDHVQDTRQSETNNRLFAHIERVDADQIKRPELQALFQEVKNRQDRSAQDIDQLRHESSTTYTIGDVIKAMQAQISDLRADISSLRAVPPPTRQ